jgi:GR25 family glycosyltransferase involved in LPS biosynthesis
MNQNFDWITYINNYDDLYIAGINTKEMAIQHWINYGKNENRTYKNLTQNNNSTKLTRQNMAIVLYVFSNDVNLSEYEEILELFDVYILTNDKTYNKFQNLYLNKIRSEENNNIFDKPNLLSKYCKTHLYLFDELKKYDYLVWFETCIINCNQLLKNICNIFDDKYDFYMYKKNIKDYRELYINNVVYENYDNMLLKKQIIKYINKNQKNKILFETDIFLFKTSIENNFFNKWWIKILKGDMLDELTFNSLNNKYIVNIKSLFSDDITHNIIVSKNKYLKYKTINNKINFIDEILWINLDRSENRKKYMLNLLKNINIPNKRIVGIDGLNFNFKTNVINGNFKKKRSNYENACLLSHLKAIISLKNKVGEYFMICEDDITFENIFLLDDDLQKIIEKAPKFDILMIHKIWYKKLQDKYVIWKDYFYENIENISSTACYIISKDGVNKINSMVNCENDIFTFYKNNILDVADIYLYNYVDTFVYKYNFASTLDNESIIHSEHLKNHIKSKIFQLEQIYNDILT